MARPTRAASEEASEAEPRRQHDNPASKSARNRAEVRAANVVRDHIRVEIQVVEQVEGIHSQFKPGVLAEHRHIRQAEALRQREIYVFISRKVERVALDPGRLRNRVSVSGPAVGSVGWTREIGRSTRSSRVCPLWEV